MAQIAHLIEQDGVAKARLPLLKMAAIGVLAGAFIAFGAMFYTLVVTGSGLVALTYWLVYLRPSDEA